jgi:hypothetical protein
MGARENEKAINAIKHLGEDTFPCPICGWQISKLTIAGEYAKCPLCTAAYYAISSEMYKITGVCIGVIDRNGTWVNVEFMAETDEDFWDALAEEKGLK